MPDEPQIKEDSNIRESVYIPKAQPHGASVRLEATRVKKKQLTTPRASQKERQDISQSTPFDLFQRKQPKLKEKTNSVNVKGPTVDEAIAIATSQKAVSTVMVSNPIGI